MQQVNPPLMSASDAAASFAAEAAKVAERPRRMLKAIQMKTLDLRSAMEQAEQARADYKRASQDLADAQEATAFETGVSIRSAQGLVEATQKLAAAELDERGAREALVEACSRRFF